MIDRMSGNNSRIQTPVVPAITSRQTGRLLVPEASTSIGALVRELTGELLDCVESTLTKVLCSRFGEVDDLARQAASLGGKRLRPTLCLLSALAVGKCNEDSIRVATTVELVHAASLVHDDVLDNAALRRHQPTIHSQIGPHRSIVLGDFLFTRAYALAASCRSTIAAKRVAAAATELCEGELRQQASIGNWHIAEAEYLDILRQKTGELCAASCRLGAWSGGGSIDQTRGLARFGRKLGIAFQIVDDWLDLWGTEQVGKTLGTDLLQRKPTLPIIRLLETQTGAKRNSLVDALSHYSEAISIESSIVRESLDQSDASDYCMNRAKRLLTSAIGDLQQLPPSAVRTCLEGIANLCIRRSA